VISDLIGALVLPALLAGLAAGVVLALLLSWVPVVWVLVGVIALIGAGWLLS
jgi:tetrahydromethanopterin S-methyltransferase subunit F